MRYQKIKGSIWNDEKFTLLNPMEQRLFLYVLTCPHGNLLGLFVLKEGYCLSDLKSLKKDFKRYLKRINEVGLIMYDEKNEVVYIPNFLKHNQITNPNQKKAANKIFNELPKSFLLNEFLKRNNGLIEGLNEGFIEGLDKVLLKPDTDTDTDTEEEGLQTKDFAKHLDFLSQIKQNPAYSHIDIDNELFKMDAWLLLPKNKGRKKTSRFILNWISKIDKPLSINSPIGIQTEPPAPDWIKEALKDGWK